MKYFITGAGGFLGSSLVKYLKDLGEDVYAAKRSSEGEAINLDITIAEQFETLDFIPDIIINCASALPDPTQSYNDPSYLKRLFDTNVIGGANLVNWAVSKKVKRIINCSTLVVVGKPWPIPLKEGAKTYPKGSHVGYSASKLSQELVMSSIAEANEIDLMHVRISALYGPDMKEGGILTKLIKQAAAKENITLMNGNQVSFDFLHVDDAVKILHHISKASAWPDNIINLASGEEISLLKLAEIVCNLYENPLGNIQNLESQNVLSRSKVNVKLLKKYIKGSGISIGPFSEKVKSMVLNQL